MTASTMKQQFNYKLIINTVVFSIIFGITNIAYGFESNARTALVIDDLTGTVLLEKNANAKIPPASMSKLMTLYMVFDALRNERLHMNDIIRVSKNASAKGGSKMFLRDGEKVSIENLIRGIIIHSGNDACIAIAETLSGTEAEFAREMNIMAKTLGLSRSSFTNSTGWPDKNHYMTATDLVNIATRIRVEFPNYYEFFAEKNFTWNEITQSNRNPMLGKGYGADGLKTGHTEEAGYGLVGSAQRGNRRVTFVISGLESVKQRTMESEKIVNWAYRDFQAKKILKKNQVIGEIPVWLGAKKFVSLAAKNDVFVLVPVSKSGSIKTSIFYDKPIQAPFPSGAPTPAKLKVHYKSETKSFSQEYELVATEGSKSGNFISRIHAASIIFLNYIYKTIK